MNTETATEAQIRYLTSLQSDKAWKKDMAATPAAGRRTRYAESAVSTVQSMRSGDARLDWDETKAFQAAALAVRNAPLAEKADFRPAKDAAAEALADRIIADEDAARLAALRLLDADPATMTKAEASAAIDALKSL